MEQWLHSCTAHDNKGAHLPQKEYDPHPSTTSACTTGLHNIGASPPSSSAVKRALSLKFTHQEPLTHYHRNYDTRKINQ